MPSVRLWSFIGISFVCFIIFRNIFLVMFCHAPQERRHTEFVSIKKDIISRMEDLDRLPDTSFEREVISEEEEAFCLSEENISSLKLLLAQVLMLPFVRGVREACSPHLLLNFFFLPFFSSLRNRRWRTSVCVTLTGQKCESCGTPCRSARRTGRRWQTT